MQAPRGLAAVIAACFAAPACAGDPPSLYAAFALDTGRAPVTVSIPFDATHWHVGAPDGPPASFDEVRRALASLQRVEIGARCGGWVYGATAYPCGFAVEVAGARRDGGQPFAAIATGWSAGRDAGAATASSFGGGAQARHRVAVRVPGVAFADGASHDALVFRIRALSNPLAPALNYERASGLAVLYPNAAVVAESD